MYHVQSAHAAQGIILFENDLGDAHAPGDGHRVLAEIDEDDPDFAAVVGVHDAGKDVDPVLRRACTARTLRLLMSVVLRR